MEISVVIPTYNRAKNLEKVLESLGKQTLSPKKFEVIVVDDGSTDDTPRIVKKFAMQNTVRVCYVLQKNRGAGAARNTGIRKACGRTLVFLDDDCVALPRLLEEHLKAHGKRKKLVVIGKVHCGNETAISKAKQIWYDLPKRGWRRFHSTNFSIGRKAILDNPFDEEFKRFQDTELAYRLQKKGFKFRFNKKAEVVHLHSWRFDEWIKMQKFYGEMLFLFYKKHGMGEKIEKVKRAEISKEKKAKIKMMESFFRTGAWERVEQKLLYNYYMNLLVYYRLLGLRTKIEEQT